MINPQMPSSVGGALSVPQQAPAPGLADRWRAWVAQPQNRAMLIQTGLSLLQPVGLGQSPIGHIANSFGQGVAAQQRNVATSTAEEDRQMEIARKKQEDVLAQKELGLRERQVASAEKNTNSMISERGKNSSLQNLFLREGLRDENNAQNKLWAYANAEANRMSLLGTKEDAKSATELMSDPVWKATALKHIQENFGSNPLAAAPLSASPAPPMVSATSPPTEEDIQFTMKRYNMTREQALEYVK